MHFFWILVSIILIAVGGNMYFNALFTPLQDHLPIAQLFIGTALLSFGAAALFTILKEH